MSAVPDTRALSRRAFLGVSLSAAGGLLLALRSGAAGQETAAAGEALGAFIRIEPDGRIVIGARGGRGDPGRAAARLRGARAARREARSAGGGSAAESEE